MSANPSKPVFRTDLDVLAQASPGQPDRYLVKDPVRGTVLELSGKDMFLCRCMDGTATLAEIAARFQSAFQLAIQPGQVAAFVESLRREGFLAGDSAAEPGDWERMKPLPLPFDRWLPAMARAVDPLTGWPLTFLLALFSVPALGMLYQYGPLIGYYLADLLTHIEMVGAAGFSSVFSVATLVQIAFFFTMIPFLREVAKAVACCHYGMRVPEIRYGWFLRFIPRCIAGIHGVVRLEKREQARVLAAGLGLEWMFFCLGMIGLGVFPSAHPLHTTSTCLAMGAALRFLLTANPLGELDGSALVAVWRGEPDLHRRSVRLFRAWLFRHPAPEPLEARRRRNLIVWGALSDLSNQGLTIAILSLLGYVLVQWAGGLGAVLLLLLVYLKYERTIISWWRGVVTDGSTMARTEQKPKRSFWLRLVLTLAVLLVVSLIPYPFDVSGEFRVQPVAKREVRAEISALIESIPVSEGSEVKAGDVIAQLSKRLIERDLEVNRASLRREREILRAMEAGARPEDIAQLEQAVKSMETKLKYSEETLVRTEELYKKNHVSDQDYQNVRQVRDLDQESLESAKLALASAVAGVREEEKEAQRAMVQSLEVTVKHLEDDLARTTIRSPIDGRVVTMHIQGRVGQQAIPGDVIAVVEDVSRTLIRIALPEQHSGLIGVGSDVRARPWAYTGRIFNGRVTSVMPLVIDKNRDVMQEASMEQEHGMVRNLNMPEERIVPVLAEIDTKGVLLRSEMTGFAKIDAGWKPLGYAFLHPVIRFLKVQVWSWIP